MTTKPQAPDLGAIKDRQQKTWSSGNFAIVGNRMVIMGELLCEAVEGRDEALARDLEELLGEWNASGDETAAVPSHYLEVVATKK